MNGMSMASYHKYMCKHNLKRNALYRVIYLPRAAHCHISLKIFFKIYTFNYHGP